MRQLEELGRLRPDVAVLPELGDHPGPHPVGDAAPGSLVSFGTIGKRGVSAAGWGPWSVAAADVPALTGGVMGAVEVSGPLNFKLIAAWPYLSEPLEQNPIVEAVARWRDWIGDAPLVVAGDFNTGGAWIEDQPSLDHRLVVAALEELGLRSAFHAFNRVEPGQDELPTHWHSRGGKHHIDYIFAPASWSITEVSIGDEARWKPLSDHAPVTAQYELAT